jgi:SAM-dependent methyltransferase
MVFAVTNPSTVPDIGAAYDAVAAQYAELFSNVLEHKPVERALLTTFAELVQAHGAGPVADIGCGPGYVTAHVHALGPTTFGIDLSPAMIALARQAYPDLRFDEGSMTALDLDDGVLGGVLAFYSTIHLSPQHLPAVFTEFYRVLAPGGYLLLGFLASHDPQPQAVDHKVALAYQWSPDSLAKLLHQPGFVEVARLSREPDEDERFRQAYLLARKP